MYNDSVPLQSTASARQAVRRLQNIGSGADSSTSFFVLAPCVPCLLSEILDRENNDQQQQQPQSNKKNVLLPPRPSSSKKGKNPSPQRKIIRSLLSKPTWLGALIALAYELQDEERTDGDGNVHHDDDSEINFFNLNFVEESRKREIFARNKSKVTNDDDHQQQQGGKSAEEFWKERMKDEEENENLNEEDEEQDDCDEEEIHEYFEHEEQKQQQQHHSPSATSSTTNVAKKRAAPSEFEKHLDEWKKRHLIAVPESTYTGTDALQLRGGKSSVITWAQREMDKYRRLAVISKIRIQDIKKETDKVLERSSVVGPGKNHLHHEEDMMNKSDHKKNSQDEENTNNSTHDRL